MQRIADAARRLGIEAGLGAALLAISLGGCAESVPGDAATMAKTELKRTQSGWELVTAKDLAEEDRAAWEAAHPDESPGFCAGDFFGDGRPAFAGLVHQVGEHGRRARLVIMGQEPSGRFVSFPVFTVSPIERLPMISKSNANEYEVHLNEQMVRVPVEGVVYDHTGLGRKLFFWSNTGFVDIELGS